MAIINQDGIWIKQFGIIPWPNIRSVAIYPVPGTPLEVIGIYIRDTALLSQQASIAGKLILLQSRLFNFPTISLDNIELENHVVIEFAKRFIR